MFSFINWTEFTFMPILCQVWIQNVMKKIFVIVGCGKNYMLQGMHVPPSTRVPCLDWGTQDCSIVSLGVENHGHWNMGVSLYIYCECLIFALIWSKYIITNSFLLYVTILKSEYSLCCCCKKNLKPPTQSLQMAKIHWI